MSTNILLLPQLDGTKTSFTIPLNGDWVDTLYFVTPGSSPVPLTLTGAIASGQPTFTISAQSQNPYTTGIIPGMAFGPCPGFPSGGYVGSVTSSTVLSFVTTQGGSTPLNSTVTDAETPITFEPLPLDLTGITFRAHIRPSAGSGVLNFMADTVTTGYIINGGTTGMISFQVPYSTIANLPTGQPTFAMDILAIADGHVINLFPAAPASVIINPGVTTYPS